MEGILFREHRGGLAESMKTIVKVNNHKELVEHCKTIMAKNNETFEPDNLNIAPYGGADSRIGWESVYIVTIKGHGVIGYTNKIC